MIHLYYGNGKGKTTAAAGLALRYSQTFAPDRVLFFQFLKNGMSAELKGLEKLGINVKSDPFYAGFVNEISPEKKQEYRTLWKEIEHYVQEYSMVVLDEFLDMYCLGVYSAEDMKEIGRIAGEADCELVLTGHKYDGVSIEAVCGQCDYVSHIEKEKHPFDLKIQARKGIEY